MLRIVSLALILLISTGVLLPLADSSAHGLRQNFIQKRYHHRRHSRAWWRRHRARMARLRMKRREAAILAHRKAVLTPVLPLQMAKRVPAQSPIPAPELVLATIPGTVQASTPVTIPASAATPLSLAVLPPASRTVPAPATAPVPNAFPRKLAAQVTVTVPAPPMSAAVATPSRTISAPPLKRVPVSASVTIPAPAPKASLTVGSKSLSAVVATTVPAAVQPKVPAPVSGPQLPVGWNPLAASKTGEVRFRTETATGVLNGQASLDVVAQSRPNPVYMSAREERRLLAGVAIADLRRIVIDKMIADGGWVINDYFRDVAGQRVFIVSAQTPGDGRSPDKSWNFYFTEVNGRIYRLTTNTPQQFSDRMAAEAESFIASFHAISKPVSK